MGVIMLFCETMFQKKAFEKTREVGLYDNNKIEKAAVAAEVPAELANTWKMEKMEVRGRM